MRIKGDSQYLAGSVLSIADLYLAPIMTYVALTPHRDEILALGGVGEWWGTRHRARKLPVYRPLIRGLQQLEVEGDPLLPIASAIHAVA